jgi:hypothetical protein
LDQEDKHEKGEMMLSRVGIDNTFFAQAGCSFTFGDFKM